MFERILVALDGTVAGESVLPYALGLAKGLDSQVTLLAVREPPPPDVAETLSRLGMAEDEPATTSRAGSYLAALGGRMPGGLAWEARTVAGPAPDAILRAAQRGGHDLIAISTRGRMGLDRWVHGSVADALVRRSPFPVMLFRARDGEEQPLTVASYQTVVVPLDGSGLSESILRYGAEIARRLELRMVLLRVVRDPENAVRWYAEAGFYMTGIQKGLREQAQTYLDRIAVRVRELGLDVATQVGEGDPVSVIVDTARATPGALIAMSTHGRSGVRRLILGSVATQVARFAETPVVLARPAGRGRWSLGPG